MARTNGCSWMCLKADPPRLQASAPEISWTAWTEQLASRPRHHTLRLAKLTPWVFASVDPRVETRFRLKYRIAKERSSALQSSNRRARFTRRSDRTLAFLRFRTFPAPWGWDLRTRWMPRLTISNSRAVDA